MKISRIREFKNFCLATAILVAGASLASCSSSDDIAENNQQPVENPTAPKVYTMTIQASKGDGATTRALTPGTDTETGKNTLNATWNTGEKVLVYQNGSKIGTLTATASTDASTTLSGTLDSAPDASQSLTFYFHTADTPSYSGQDGTLATIASTYDFCEAATVTKGNFTVNTSDNTVNVPAGISFGANQQAIVKFTLIDKADGTTPLNAKPLVVNVGTTNYTINPASATDVIYVAIPGFSGQTVTLTATVGSYTYTYQKLDVTFINGKYYEITVKMTKDPRYDNEVNINTYVGSEPIAVPTGKHWLIKGNVDGEGNVEGTSNQITIKDDATVTLSNVNIRSGSYCIKCEGDATIILKDGSTNTLTCSDFLSTTYLNTNPALWAGGSGKTLTIKGTGSIVAKGGDYAAGIGCGQGTCGNIVIEGGDITAYGGGNAAGIGSGGGGTCGTITITGGTIEATGGTYAPGIGSGDEGSCCAITIASTVSSVIATKGNSAPNSIGAGFNGTCGTVTIGCTLDDAGNPVGGTTGFVSTSPYTYPISQ